MAEEIKGPKTVRGWKIRLGQQKVALEKAKAAGKDELALEIQADIQNLERGLTAAEQGKKPGADGPAAVPGGGASVPPAGVPLTDEECLLVIGILNQASEVILSMIARQKFKIEMDEKAIQSQVNALKISSAKRLTPEQRAKFDLFTLIGAFAAPIAMAIPKALELRNRKAVPADAKTATVVETDGPKTSAPMIVEKTETMSTAAGPGPIVQIY